MTSLQRSCVVAGAALLVNACAGLNLNRLVQPPRFTQASDRPAEIRLDGPTSTMPLGGASVRLWTEVTNPNPFGLTLQTLKGTLYLEDTRAADADFPLGLPLAAAQQTTIPIDIAVSFSDIPGLASVVRRAVGRQPIACHLDGTIGIDVPRVGQGMIFGPMTILRGDVSVAHPLQLQQECPASPSVLSACSR
jgi:hypothetical protein